MECKPMFREYSTLLAAMHDCSRDENCRGISKPCDTAENQKYSTCGHSPPSSNYNMPKFLRYIDHCKNAVFYQKSI